MLRHALEAQGHAVLEARDEAEAIHQLQQTRPAVVLTDLTVAEDCGLFDGTLTPGETVICTGRPVQTTAT